MRTFREIYCERHRCPPDKFTRRIFWRTLYPHARLVAPLILLFNYEFFSADRALIVYAGDALSVAQVRDEVRDFFWDSNNRRWLRGALRLRVSGERLKNLSRRYLPEHPAETKPASAAGAGSPG
jgi:hypothetical protein